VTYQKAENDGLRILVLTSRNLYRENGERTLMLSKQAALEAEECQVAYVACRWGGVPETSDLNILFQFRTWEWLIFPIRCYRQLKAAVQGWRPDVLVVSGGWLAANSWVLERIKREQKIALSVDLQGVLEELTEYAMVKGNRVLSRALYYLLRRQERRLVEQVADVVEVVSHNFARYVRERYPRFSGAISVVPCGLSIIFDDHKYSENRAHWRQKLAIEPSRLAAVYVGGLYKWQRVREVVDFARRRQDWLFFLFVNGDIASLGGLPANVRISRLPHNDMLKALCAFDYGFLLRNDDVTNRVAFPNKASEYLNARLKIIVDSKNLGCIRPEYSQAFCSVDEVSLVDPTEFKKSYAIQGLLYEQSVAGLLAAYRSAISFYLAETESDQSGHNGNLGPVAT